MRIATAATGLALAVALAGCGSRDKEPSITVRDDSGNTIASVDGGNGQVKLDLPGLSGSLNLPKIKIDADDLDLNGLSLYPGSTVNGVNVTDDDDARRDVGHVRVAFTSPASEGDVRAWFVERMGKAGYKVVPDAAGLAGIKGSGEVVHLELRPAGAAQTAGTLLVRGGA